MSGISGIVIIAATVQVVAIGAIVMCAVYLRQIAKALKGRPPPLKGVSTRPPVLRERAETPSA